MLSIVQGDMLKFVSNMCSFVSACSQQRIISSLTSSSRHALLIPSFPGSAPLLSASSAARSLTSSSSPLTPATDWEGSCSSWTRVHVQYHTVNAQQNIIHLHIVHTSATVLHAANVRGLHGLQSIMLVTTIVKPQACHGKPFAS